MPRHASSVLLFQAFVLGACGAQPRKVAEWAVSEVATLNFAEDLPGMPGTSLVGTTFGPNPFGGDSAFALGPLSARGDAKVTTMSTHFSWPNEAQQVTEATAAGAHLRGNLVMVADGFLLPLKQTGGIHLLNITDGLSEATKTTISQDKHAWFYHHAEWLDVDGDGVLDVVAARAVKPFLVGQTDGELVWMKNNADGTFGDTKVLANGPDVGFRVHDIDNDGMPEIIATEFFKYQELAVYSCSEKTWADCGIHQSAVKTVLDSGAGGWFQDSLVDLNGDGRLEILATQQQNTADGKTTPGQVVAFEAPSDGSVSGSWSRHVLADGYLPKPKMPTGSGAPGEAVAFQMDTRTRGKPHIIVTGDDGGVVDLLTPSSQDRGDWTYAKETLYTSTATTVQGVSTIGTVRVADIDGSGRPEVFIASYAENKLFMYTFDETAPEGPVVV